MKRVLGVYSAPHSHRVGDGFPVRSLFSCHSQGRQLSPFLLLAGEPIDEPIFGYGPFVMNSEAEIEQAIDDYEGGRFGAISRGPTDFSEEAQTGLHGAAHPQAGAMRR